MNLVILANPSFKGNLDADTVSTDLQKVCKTRKTELLFLALFVRMLKIGGRCACIVPDGVLFGSSNAHKAIRKEIVENQRLEAVISMPSGVFKPYAGVSTGILIFIESQAPESAQKNINLKILSELKVINPSKEAQVEFEEFVEQVDKSKVVVQKALNETQTLFDSLMQEFFG